MNTHQPWKHLKLVIKPEVRDVDYNLDCPDEIQAFSFVGSINVVRATDKIITDMMGVKS